MFNQQPQMTQKTGAPDLWLTGSIPLAPCVYRTQSSVDTAGCETPLHEPPPPTDTVTGTPSNHSPFPPALTHLCTSPRSTPVSERPHLTPHVTLLAGQRRRLTRCALRVRLP